MSAEIYYNLFNVGERLLIISLFYKGKLIGAIVSSALALLFVGPVVVPIHHPSTQTTNKSGNGLRNAQPV